MMRCNLSCWFNILSIELKHTKQHKKSILFPLQLIVMLLLAMPSSSFRQPHSLVCLFDCWLDWLLCLYSIPSGRDSCHHLLCFRPFLPPTSRLIVAFNEVCVGFCGLSFPRWFIHSCDHLSTCGWPLLWSWPLWLNRCPRYHHRHSWWCWWWLGGYLEAAGHGWGGWGKNGEKRVLSPKKLMVAFNVLIMVL